MTKVKKTTATKPANQFGEPGFEVRSPCGRVYFVPFKKVREDYAFFLQQADGLDEMAALEKASKNEAFLQTWFVEQFDWEDVARNGNVVKAASAEDIERALDFLRNNASSSPANDYTAFDVPD
jgi:hypothetical protein